jgi:hypothetical protein
MLSVLSEAAARGVVRIGAVLHDKPQRAGQRRLSLLRRCARFRSLQQKGFASYARLQNLSCSVRAKKKHVPGAKNDLDSRASNSAQKPGLKAATVSTLLTRGCGRKAQPL